MAKKFDMTDVKKLLEENEDFFNYITSKYDFLWDNSSIKNEVLNLFLNFFANKPSSEHSSALKKWCLAFDQMKDNEKNLELLFQTDLTNDNRKKSIIMATGFFLYFEGCYVTTIDQICELLITEGHDLFDFYRRKYVKSLEEIGNLDTFVKFRFLEEHGFGFFVRERDRELRNKIAHLQYSISNEGNLKINEKEIDINLKYKDLRKCVENFNKEITIALEAFVEIVREVQKRKKSNTLPFVL